MLATQAGLSCAFKHSTQATAAPQPPATPDQNLETTLSKNLYFEYFSINFEHFKTKLREAVRGLVLVLNPWSIRG